RRSIVRYELPAQHRIFLPVPGDQLRTERCGPSIRGDVSGPGVEPDILLASSLPPHGNFCIPVRRIGHRLWCGNQLCGEQRLCLSVLPLRQVAEETAFRRTPHKVTCQVNGGHRTDRKSTRLNSSHVSISYAVFCLKKKRKWNCETCYELSS